MTAILLLLMIVIIAVVALVIIVVVSLVVAFLVGLGKIIEEVIEEAAGIFNDLDKD